MLLLVTACSGTSSPAPVARPAAWAAAFCNGVAAVGRDGSSLQTDVPTLQLGPPRTLRDEFANGLGVVAQDYRRLHDVLVRLGPPKVAGGPAIQNTVLGALDRGADAFGAARKTVAGASTDARAVDAAVLKVTGDLRATTQQIGAAFTKINALDTGKTLSTAGGSACTALS